MREVGGTMGKRFWGRAFRKKPFPQTPIQNRFFFLLQAYLWIAACFVSELRPAEPPAERACSHSLSPSKIAFLFLLHKHISGLPPVSFQASDSLNRPPIAALLCPPSTPAFQRYKEDGTPTRLKRIGGSVSSSRALRGKIHQIRSRIISVMFAAQSGFM